MVRKARAKAEASVLEGPAPPWSFAAVGGQLIELAAGLLAPVDFHGPWTVLGPCHWRWRPPDLPWRGTPWVWKTRGL